EVSEFGGLLVSLYARYGALLDAVAERCGKCAFVILFCQDDWAVGLKGFCLMEISGLRQMIRESVAAGPRLA
ncbi:hypothetical protein HDV05_001773, partial [Chytridiales sp. JEL 0842]